MDEADFEELKLKFYDKDWYSFEDFIRYMRAIIGDAADDLRKSMQSHKNIKKSNKIPKEYLVCALATALDATHEDNPEILNNKRWVMWKMKQYDKKV